MVLSTTLRSLHWSWLRDVSINRVCEWTDWLLGLWVGNAICVHSIVLSITWKTSVWIFFHYCNSQFDMWAGRQGNYFYDKYLENHKWVKAVFLMSVCTWQHWYKILYKKNFIKIFRLNGRLYRSNYKRAWIRQTKVRFS